MEVGGSMTSMDICKQTEKLKSAWVKAVTEVATKMAAQIVHRYCRYCERGFEGYCKRIRDGSWGTGSAEAAKKLLLEMVKVELNWKRRRDENER